MSHISSDEHRPAQGPSPPACRSHEVQTLYRRSHPQQTAPEHERQQSRLPKINNVKISAPAHLPCAIHCAAHGLGT